MDIDWSTRYRSPVFPGVALRIVGFVQTWEPETSIAVDKDGVEYVCETGEGEWVDDPSGEMVRVIMVGDDRTHEVALADLVPLAEVEYCGSCGQVGCTHDGRD